MWKKVSTKAHVRSQAAARRNPLLAGQGRDPDNGGAMKLVVELKPDVLSHAATAGQLQIWLKQIEAYYHASNMQVARIAVQKAYLRSFLDNALALQLDSSVQQTTPVIGGGVKCISTLSAIFKRKYMPFFEENSFSK